MRRIYLSSGPHRVLVGIDSADRGNGSFCKWVWFVLLAPRIKKFGGILNRHTSKFDFRRMFLMTFDAKIYIIRNIYSPGIT